MQLNSVFRRARDDIGAVFSNNRKVPPEPQKRLHNCFCRVSDYPELHVSFKIIALFLSALSTLQPSQCRGGGLLYVDIVHENLSAFWLDELSCFYNAL